MADEDKTQGTAKPGSEPGKDGKESGAGPDKQGTEAKQAAGSSAAGEEKLPFDQHPKWKAARAAEKALQDLMEANSLDSVDELVELVESGKTTKGKLGQVSESKLEELMTKAATLEKYEAYWRDQEEKNRRQTEDPEQTIKRLEAEKRALMAKKDEEKERAKLAEETKKIWDSFDREVETLVDAVEDVPKALKPFYVQFFGVKNPASTVDFKDKRAIRKMVADGLKVIDAYNQEVIRNYVGGKKQIPNVPSTEGASTEKPKVKGLRDAARIMRETLGKLQT